MSQENNSVNSILRSPELSQLYAASVTLGSKSEPLALGHDVAGGASIQDSIDMIHMIYGADISKLNDENIRLNMTLKSGAASTQEVPEALDIPIPPASGNVRGRLMPLFKDLAVFDTREDRPSGHGMARSSLIKILQSPHGLGALQMFNRSDFGAKALASAVNTMKNGVKLVQANPESGQKPLLKGPPPTPFFYRMDNNQVRLSANIANCSSPADLFSRVVFASCLKDALQVELSQSMVPSLQEMESGLYSHPDAYRGCVISGINKAVTRAYPGVLLANSQAIDNGYRPEIRNGSPLETALLKDINAFRTGNYRKPTNELSVRAFNYSINAGGNAFQQSINADPNITWGETVEKLRSEARDNLVPWANGANALREYGHQHKAGGMAELSRSVSAHHGRSIDHASSSALDLQKRRRRSANDQEQKSGNGPKR